MKTMRNLLSATLLAGLLGMPSAVLAEATWYGSIRTGIESAPHNAGTATSPDFQGNSIGVADFDSRWGIKGSAEASEGLTAVYRYERKIDSTDASDPNDADGNDIGGRLSYVGLSGGFGTITVGQVWGAPYNHFGAIVDQSLNYGSVGMAGTRYSNTVSYAVSVGNVSLQADAVMDVDDPKINTGLTLGKPGDKTVDSLNFGATIGGIGETGKIAIAYRRHPDLHQATNSNSKALVTGGPTLRTSSAFIAGSYGIGGTTMFLGYSQDTRKDAECTAANNALTKGIVTTTFAANQNLICFDLS